MATKDDNRRSPERRHEESFLALSRSGTREPPVSIDEAGIAELIAFFRLLRKWDQEAQYHEEV